MVTTATPISPVAQIEALAARLAKARELAAAGKVFPVIGKENHYAVIGSVGVYIVNGACLCPDADHRAELHNGWCKHKLAVEVHKEAQQAQADKPAPKARRGKGAAEDTEAMKRAGHYVPDAEDTVREAGLEEGRERLAAELAEIGL